MTQAKEGDTIRVHYTGTLPDGTVFDSSKDRDPLEFQVGAGQVIAGFDRMVEGMAPGDTRKETIPADDAYGPRSDARVIDVPRQQLPDGMEPEVGQVLELQGAGGETAVAVVAEIGEATLKLDANHPLAGRDLTFEVELVEIVP